MPSTPTYNLPYPALSDPPNGAAAVQALAEGTEIALASAGKKPVIHKSGTVDTAVKVTHFTVCTIVIPDPGWPYHLFFSGCVQFSEFETSWDFYVQNAATSVVYSNVTQLLWQAHTNNVKETYPITGAYTTALTGGLTLGVAAVKTAGAAGNGGSAYAAPYTSVSALVVPA